MWSRGVAEDAAKTAAGQGVAADNALEVTRLRTALRVMEDEFAALTMAEAALGQEIVQLKKSGQALQASMKSKEKKPLRAQMAEKRKEKILLKKKLMVLAPPHVNELPAHLLIHDLTTAIESEDLLAHVALSALVCSQWRKMVINREPYGRGLYDDPVGEKASGVELQLAIDMMRQLDDKDSVEKGVRGPRLAIQRAERARVLGAIRGQVRLDPIKQLNGQLQACARGPTAS